MTPAYERHHQPSIDLPPLNAENGISERPRNVPDRLKLPTALTVRKTHDG